MIQIRVFFKGLISHIGNTPARRTYSAMLHAAGHQAMVSWSGGVPVRLTGNEVLRFDPETAGAADSTNPDFLDHVPALSRLTFKNAGAPAKHPSVGRDHTRAIAYFRHRAGRFRVASYFRELAEYCDNGVTVWGPTCVADVVELTIDFPVDEVRLLVGRITGGASVEDPLSKETALATFTKNAWIAVTNEPIHAHPVDGAIRCGDPAYGHHWAHHKTITDADRIAGIGKHGQCERWQADPFKGADAAPDDESIRVLNLYGGEIECSNSSWP